MFREYIYIYMVKILLIKFSIEIILIKRNRRRISPLRMTFLSEIRLSRDINKSVLSYSYIKFLN